MLIPGLCAVGFWLGLGGLHSRLGVYKWRGGKEGSKAEKGEKEAVSKRLQAEALASGAR